MNQDIVDITILYHKKDLMWLRWIEYFLRNKGYTLSLVDFTSGKVRNIPDWIIGNATDVSAVMILEAEEMFSSGSLLEEWPSKIGAQISQNQVAMVRRKGLPFPKLPATFNSEFIGDDESEAKEQMGDLIASLQLRSFNRDKIAASNTMEAPVYPGNLPRNFRMPYARVSNFIGRFEEYDLLEKLSAKEPLIVIKNRIGGRGFGLTSTMTQFVYENIERYSTIWWMPAYDPLLMTDALKELGSRFGVQGLSGGFGEMWLKVLKAMSGKAKLPFLVILDRPNSDMMKDFEALASTPWKSGLLVALAGDPKRENVPEIGIGMMNRKESKELILSISDASDAPVLDDVATFLKNHPLLMRMAARIIKGGRQADRYLEDCELEAQLVRVKEPFLKPFMINVRFMIDQLQAVNSDAEKLLVFGAYFTDLPIPSCMFEPSKKTDPMLASVVGNPKRLQAAIRLLEEYGAINRGQETFVVHPIIAQCVRNMEDYRKDWPDIIVGTFSEKLSPSLPAETLEDRRGEVYPHAVQMCLDRVRSGRITEDSVVLINNIANEARALQNLPVATELLQAVMNYYLKESGENNENVSGLAMNLGMIFKLENKLDDAALMFKKALRIDESIFGADHINVAEDHVQLARLEEVQKKYVEADFHYSKAVAIMKMKLGEMHPRLARVLSDYIVVLKGIKNTAPIYGYAKTIVAIETKVYGADSPKLCNSLATLGLAAAEAGQLGEAQTYLKQSMEMEEKMFGPHHPKVAVRLGQLGNLMERTGNKANALEHYKRAFGIFNNSIGADHPSTKIIGECLARVQAT